MRHNARSKPSAAAATRASRPIYLGQCDACFMPLYSPARVIDGTPNRIVHGVCPRTASMNVNERT